MVKHRGRLVCVCGMAAALLTGRVHSAGNLHPTNSPGPTMHTLEQIYQKVADPAPQHLQTFSPTTSVVNAGYYEATNLTVIDGDLATANIRAGVTLFGVTGKTEVVDTTSGDATPADIADGTKAWVDGIEVTGTGTVSGAWAAPVPKTGAGDLPPYYAVPGEDGHADVRRGVRWPNPRFTDNADGTVTDNLTGLVWLKDANAFSGRQWHEAVADCNTLNSGEHGLTDGSVEGAWRLPNIQELQSLIDYGRSIPALCDTAGTGQWSEGDPFTDVQTAVYYWMSTTYAYNTAQAWRMVVGNGWFDGGAKTSQHYVWPVRDGE